MADTSKLLFPSSRFCIVSPSEPFLSLCEKLLVYPEPSGYLRARDKKTNTMKNPSKNASPLSNQVRELRTELARRIASFMGSEENRAGSVLAMRPLIVHSSSKSRLGAARRVLHIEYAASRVMRDGLELAVP